MKNNVFIDWLSVYQIFDDVMPALASELKTTTCMLTGEILREMTVGYQHPGSYDTSILIKYDHGRLSMSGNPSAFNRKDNLFGITTMPAAIEVYNKILRDIGYPQFTDMQDTKRVKNEKKYTGTIDEVFEKKLASDYDNTRARAGVVITRIDLTKNFATNAPAHEVLRYLSTFTHRTTHGFLYPNGMTVDWNGDRSGETGGSKRLYFKYYSKAFEIAKKLKKLTMKQQRMRKLTISTDKKSAHENFLLGSSQSKNELGNVVTTNFYASNQLKNIEKQITYLTQLYEYTTEHNVVRFEVELKSKTLAEQGLTRLIDWSDDMINEQFEKYLLHKNQEISLQKDRPIYDQLIEIGIKKTSARSIAGYAQLWLDGHDLRPGMSDLMSTATYYRVRAVLKKVGIDIATRMNVASFPRQIQTVMLSDLEIPSWYEAA